MQEKKKKNKYYSLDNILKEKATYNVIIGERSNGKTYSVEDYSLKDFCESGYTNQLGIVRRYRDDFVGKRGDQMFDALVENGLVIKYTKGEWTHIRYRASRWYLAKYDEKIEKWVNMEKPFAFGFSLSTQEHDKSTSYPNIKNILFDEFLTRGMYLNDEFVMFMNTLSTIIRDRDNIKIFMCGNTVNKYSPYFAEMGLTNIENMKQGDIDVYTYGNSSLTVAVEYCKPNEKGKKSDKYFAFNNPKLSMITGGAWEISIYPHLPVKYNRVKDVKLKYFIVFNNNILQCEIVRVKTDRPIIFTYIHRKTTELKNLQNDIIFETGYSPEPNKRRFINHPQDDIGRIIYKFFKEDKVFYQDNEIGEIVRNYLNWCATDKGFV